MLKTRVSRIGVTIAALAGIACPAAAFAAAGQGSDGGGSPPARIPARMTPLQRPTRHLHRTIEVQISQIRFERRARLRKQRREAFATLPGGVS